jgi:hypothetical protein
MLPVNARPHSGYRSTNFSQLGRHYKNKKCFIEKSSFLGHCYKKATKGQKLKKVTISLFK